MAKCFIVATLLTCALAQAASAGEEWVGEFRDELAAENKAAEARVVKLLLQGASPGEPRLERAAAALRMLQADLALAGGRAAMPSLSEAAPEEVPYAVLRHRLRVTDLTAAALFVDRTLRFVAPQSKGPEQ